jgi:hypothetical protein
MSSLNKIYKYTFAGILCLILFISCTTTKQTLYLQEIEISGPINQAPIHITDSIQTPSVIISPRFSVNTQKNITANTGGHSMVNTNGVFQVDTSFFDDGTVKYTEAPGQNVLQFEDHDLTWNVSTFTAGIDFDFLLTSNFALFGGVSYSSQQGGGVWGGNAGLGLFGNGKSVSFRFDAGVHIQTIKYDAYTIADIQSEDIFGGSDEYVVFYHDIDKSTNFDPFINFTINSSNKEWLINYFFNAGYSIQSLYDFGPQAPDTRYYNFLFLFPTGIVITQDFRGENSAGFFNFTPGIYFNLNENSRVLLGVRFYFETQLENPSTSTFILPMLQADFTL